MVNTTETVSSRRSLHPGLEEEEVQEELRRLVLVPAKGRRSLLKQVSMKETSREAAWERRRHQFRKRQRSFCTSSFRARKAKTLTTVTPAVVAHSRSLTDEDLDELKGCLDLGFDFKEEDDQCLTNTLPALGLYFAVKRQFSDPRLSTHRSSTSQSSTPDSPCGSRSSLFGSPRSPQTETSSTTPTWKICSPGDNPQHVKTRLRHWSQLVACSLKQFC